MSRKSLALLSAASVLSLSVAAHAADPELTVLDWAGWEIDGMLQPYVDKHGQKPSYVFFADDDEAFQKVSSGFKADVVHPCAASVPRYKEAGLVEPWDISKIPEFANIPERMTKPFTNEEGVFYIPTDYAYTAIAYNAETVPAEDVATVQVFASEKYAGRIALPDNTDDVWSLAFLATGVTSWDNVTDEQFQAAADWLRAVHPNVRAYWADPSELSQLMASGEVQVAWSWNDPVAILQGENFPVGFNRSPAEGAATWYGAFFGPAALGCDWLRLGQRRRHGGNPGRGAEGRIRRPGDHNALRAVTAHDRTPRPHDRGIRADQVGLLSPTFV
ncbi:MAG: extracellular solute-binding protein [Tabrizicola sp.]|nr:extracellular solute-binding protein [Tabrizicola sp.]